MCMCMYVYIYIYIYIYIDIPTYPANIPVKHVPYRCQSQVLILCITQDSGTPLLVFPMGFSHQINLVF